MKLIVILLTTAILQVSASSYGQLVTLKHRNAKLTVVLDQIRKQTGYDFLYSQAAIEAAKPVSVDIEMLDLRVALELCLRNQPLTYSISNKIVTIKDKEMDSPNQRFFGLADTDIKGEILDESGLPLAGATIKVKRTNKTFVTNNQGKFTLVNVLPGDLIQIIYVGYETAEIVLNTDQISQNSLTIRLKPAIGTLNEVAVINTGYQKLSKINSPASAVTVNAAELEKRYTPNILDNLEGRSPGLVNYKGSVVIRGISTFTNGSRDPLYVVDGLPVEGSVANINPYDVETITVLKDAAAAAIYGVRASNGVVVITTKRAKKAGTTIEFATDVTITDKLNYDKFNYLTAAQQVDVERDYANWYFTNPTNGAANVTAYMTQITNGNPITPIMYLHYQYAQQQVSKSQLDQTLATYRQNDFTQEFEDNALLNQLLQQYNFAVRSSGEKFQSNLLLNYKTDNSGIINAYRRQLNIFYKGTYRPYDWLNIDFGVNSILGKIKESNSNFATSGINVPSYMRLLDDAGQKMYYTTSDYNVYNGLNSSTTPQLQSMLVNHLDELELDSRLTHQNFGRYFVNLKATILPGLTFSPQFQYENNITSTKANSEAESYSMRFLRNIFTTRTGASPNFTYNYLVPAGGRLSTTEQTVDAWTARGQVDYNKQLNKHDISVIAGTEFRENLRKGTRGLLLGYSDQLQSHNTGTVNFQAISALGNSTFFKPGTSTTGLANALTDQVGLIQETRQRSNSLYANATYTFDRKYNVFGSYRIDYADVFGLDEKYRGRPLWSTGIGWNISNEDFLKNFNWIDFLKLRATYGVTGNIAPGLSSLLVANSALPVNPSTQLPVSVVENSGNPQLTWEKTATTNIGLDFTLFKGRLNGAFDWYRKVGSDIFSSTRIDPSKGFLSQVINNGNLLNKGIELSIQYQWFRPSGPDAFGWSSNFVVSKNRNKVTHVDQVANTPALLTSGGLKEGYPVQSLFSYQFGGLNSVGLAQWYKANGTLTTAALTNDDLSAIVFSGGLDPITNITLINEFTYKRFSLNILGVYYGGHYQRVPQVAGVGSAYGVLPNYTLDAWTPTNTGTNVMPYGQYQPAGISFSNQNTNSDVFVRPSDFIKIRSVGLAYRLPTELSSKLGSRNVSLRFQLNNPKAVWIKNKVNIDPETGTAPVLTSYVFGLNFNL